MSQFYDQASLVMVPSGYKAGKVYSQKPLTTDGQLTFTRTGDTATRLNADGLVEKVRTNLLLQSNTFNTTWSPVGSPTITANYDTNPLTGANDAWRFVSTGTGDRLVQSISGSNNTFSLYVKGSGTLQIRDNSGTYYKNAVLTSSWQRVSVYISASFTNVQFHATSGVCDATIYAAQLETGDIATAYIPTTTAAVSVGPVANLPRIDYTGGACGKLLLEPQRTNQTLFSEQFDNGWSSSVTIVPNQAVSPDGYQNADLLYSASSGSGKRVLRSSGVTVSTAYTFSVYAKAAGQNFIYFPDVNNLVNNVWFNLSNGTFSTPSQGTASMIDCGNGWYRCICTTTATTTVGYSYIGISSSSGSTVFNTDGTTGVYVWGAQLEAGSYATSYIPTLSAAVTRGADAAYKTGISSLIGQTEGTLFLEFDMFPCSANFVPLRISGAGGLFNDSQNIVVRTDRTIQGWSFTGAIIQASIISAAYSLGTKMKVAYAYKANDFVLYVNGVQIGTDNSGTLPAMSEVLVGSYYPSVAINEANRIDQALLFKTRLTNAQLAELTTL